MVNFRFPVAMFSLLLVLSPMIHYAGAHENLNSGDESIGNYEVQVATDPEIPSANQPFKLSFRILNYQSASNLLNSFNTKLSEVDHFRMGVRIYYNNELVSTIPVQDFKGGEWSTSYIFHESGNHIMFVDLYDVGPGGQPLTFIYNISVLDVFGPLFQYIISAGGIACFVLLVWVIITNKKKKEKPKA
ncbi:hypothetical protein DYY67_2253 [Candidatus Nitrosotalea sp. TS]|uniref:hypothetical protein n=1 Tax=Candidatus Nitrosotalea sp. TS TaxID=2341020 RepID=UPI00140B4B4F|nr:hypothetical protein [Candidatus Nitrosotalea sp. TS]NHI03617.1 hypothetical protein [Candidatus Nitrosotalea sp. TS]